MTVKNEGGGLVNEDGARDRFPVGMRVLAVDDDPICLKLLEGLLRKCQYQVTTTNQAITALKMLRENRNKFDLVISDVNMPDMDGFKLLELVGLEMDLPVIMLSAHSDTKLVMKGVTHGACDYLLKPVRIEELKNIWQHVVRRKNSDCKDQNKATNGDKAPNMAGEGSHGITSENSADQNKRLVKKRKDQGEEEEEEEEEDVVENGHEDEDPSTQKKPRVVWSAELHRKFVAAVNQLGLEKAVPKKILDMMNVEGLTRENVASHLQKFRLYLKKTTQQANMVAALGSTDSYLRLGSIDGYGDFFTSSRSGRISSTTLPSYASSGMFGRPNSPAGLRLRGISSPALIRPVQSQNINSPINTLGNVQPSVFPANHSSSLLQSIPTSVELNQSQQSNRTTGVRQLSPVDNSRGFAVSPCFQDNRATVGSANNPLSCVPNNHSMLQGNSQQTPISGALGNQSSLRAGESSDVNICGSSNWLGYNRCNESWQSAAQLSKLPASTLPLNEGFSNDQLPPTSLNVSSSSTLIRYSPVDLSSRTAFSVPLEDASNVLQCQDGLIGNIVQSSSYTPQQRWEEHKQDYNQSISGPFNSINSQVSSTGVASSSLGNSLNQNNTIFSKRFDASLIGQLNGTVPSLTPTEVVQFSSDIRLQSSDAYILAQMKSQDELVQNNFGSLEDMMSAMVKPMMDGEMGFDAYPVGSCM